jgi:hypothetical protein
MFVCGTIPYLPIGLVDTHEDGVGHDVSVI